MKIYAHHDSEGTILRLIAVDAPEGCGMMLTPKPGAFVAEVEGLKLKPGAPDVKELRAIAASHKVSAPVPRCTLEKKR